ncbi:MAG: DinB family protein [Acidobacteriota bacterium]
MAMKDALLPEFDHEVAVTRTVLERIAEDRFAFQPHEKSMTLGRLAAHLADLTSWGQTILHDPEFNMVTGAPPRPTPSTRAEILQMLDENAKKVRALLANISDAELMNPWALKHDGKELFSMPRAAAWRAWVMSHMIHHRGQLSVYLRLTGSKVPSIYGPSADQS